MGETWHVVSLGLPISIIMTGFNNRGCWRGRSFTTKQGDQLLVSIRGWSGRSSSGYQL